MSADGVRPRKGLLRELFWTRTTLLLSLLIVVSMIAMTVSSAMAAGTLKNFVLALGTGTLISAIVGFGQTLITASASQRVLVDSVVQEISSLMQKVDDDQRAANREFFPTDIFEPTPEPDLAFNRFMTEDLRRTREYLFRGFSGRHAAARMMVSNAERVLQVAIADLLAPNSVVGRANYLLRSGRLDADYATICATLKEEVHIGLVGLYLARGRCRRIDVIAVAEPALDRVEIFDESIWITLFSDSAGATMLYPRTLRFAKTSFLYNKERAEFDRISNSRQTRHIIIEPATTDGEFFVLFEKITGTPLTDDTYADLEAKFQVFRERFAERAGLER